MIKKAQKYWHLAGIVCGTLLLTPQAYSSDLWQADIAKLKGRIIRSLTVSDFDHNQIIVGNKGSNPGDATVFASNNGGISWRFLNGNQPLHPSASDVQAVKVVSPQIILAGTWKHGLFRSTDAGASFAPVANFAARDVRSLAVSSSTPGTVYAATGSSGILKSLDSGASWSATRLSDGYFWSVSQHASSGQLAASSPNKGVFLSSDGGDSWQSHLPSAKAYDAEYSPVNPEIIAVAADNGLYLSNNAGRQWQQPAAFRDKQLRSVSFDSKDSSVIIVGDWGGGVWRYSLADNTASQFQSQLRTLHVESSSQALFIGTWGAGLHVLPHTADTSYLINATKAGDKNAVGQLLSSGVNVDVFDAARNTSLIYASRDGQLDIAKSLIQSGANVNWVDGEGVTPLILASHKNHPKLVQLLLANNADASIVDGFGNTAKQYAERRGTDDVIYRLLNR